MAMPDLCARLCAAALLIPTADRAFGLRTESAVPVKPALVAISTGAAFLISVTGFRTLMTDLKSPTLQPILGYPRPKQRQSHFAILRSISKRKLGLVVPLASFDTRGLSFDEVLEPILEVGYSTAECGDRCFELIGGLPASRGSRENVGDERGRGR